MRLRAPWVGISLLSLGWMLVGTACGDDDDSATSVTADAGLDATDDGAPREEPAEASAPEAGPHCPGVAAAPALSGTCGSCTSASCCAQASACFVTGSCQKVIDCIDNCTRGALPDGGLPQEDGDAGDAGEGDVGEAGDAGDDGDSVQACVDACTAPLAAEVEVLSALSDCQAVNCAEACPAQ